MPRAAAALARDVSIGAEAARPPELAARGFELRVSLFVGFHLFLDPCARVPPSPCRTTTW